jgi:hypothetical protein
MEELSQEERFKQLLSFLKDPPGTPTPYYNH